MAKVAKKKKKATKKKAVKKKATKKKAAKRAPRKKVVSGIVGRVLVTKDKATDIYVGRLLYPGGEALSQGRTEEEAVWATIEAAYLAGAHRREGSAYISPVRGDAPKLQTPTSVNGCTRHVRNNEGVCPSCGEPFDD